MEGSSGSSATGLRLRLGGVKDTRSYESNRRKTLVSLNMRVRVNYVRVA